MLFLRRVVGWNDQYIFVSQHSIKKPCCVPAFYVMELQLADAVLQLNNQIQAQISSEAKAL